MAVKLGGWYAPPQATPGRYSAIAARVLFTIIIALNTMVGAGELWAAVILMFIIVIVQNFGWQAKKLLYSSENALLEYRRIGIACFASGEWLMVFTTVMTSLIDLASCGWSLWLSVLTSNLVGIVFVYSLCLEMAGECSKVSRDALGMIM